MSSATLSRPLVGGATACFLVPELLDLKEISHHKSSPTQFIQILLHVHVHIALTECTLGGEMCCIIKTKLPKTNALSHHYYVIIQR